MKVSSAAYAGDGRIEVGQTVVQGPGPGQVQVEVAYVGICGTDLHILHGAMDARIKRPAVIGHEMSGTIAEIGDGVEGWAPGDAVTVMPLVWDGTCPACRAGHQHVCHNLDFVGIDSPGALQQRWNVRAELLVRLPASLELRDAALVEPVAVAVHDVRRSGLTASDRAVILGGGPIGVLIATVARHTGAEVLVVEPDAGRRSAVEALGLPAIAPGDHVATHVEEWSDGAGADVVFEVSGAPQAVRSATELAKVRGVVVIVAIHGQAREVDLKQVFWRELTILGARVYERTDFEQAVALLEGGDVPASSMITAVVPIERVTKAFETLEAGEAMKVLVDCQGDMS